MSWFITGENVPPKIARIFSTPGMAAVLTIYASASGVIGSLIGEQLQSSSALFLEFSEHDDLEPDWLVTAFWIGILAWSTFFYIRMIVEKLDRTRLERAIHRCPNPRILNVYRERFNALSAATLPSASTQTKIDFHDVATELTELEQRIREALSCLLSFCQEFSDPTKTIPMGINVMLVAHPDEFNGDILFFNSKERRKDSLTAVLFMPESLILSTSEATRISPVALPVPHCVSDEQGIQKALPGAPVALLTGRLSVQEDTRKMADECTDFERATTEHLRAHFGPDGNGKDIRSFASIRLGDEKDPIGVLNVDCPRTNLLGEETEYYGTFLALISPMLYVLTPEVAKYAKLLRDHKA